MTLEQIETLGTILGIVVAAFAVVAGYKKFIHKYVVITWYEITKIWYMLTGSRSTNKKIDEFIETAKQNHNATMMLIEHQGKKMNDLLGKVELIKGEVTTNGSKSLKDEVVKISAIQLAELNEDKSAIIVMTDKDGNVTHVNRVFTSITGRNASEFLGSNWVNVIHPKDRDRIIREWHNAVKYNRDYDGEFSFIDINEKEIKVVSRAKKLPNNLGYYARILLDTQINS